MGHLLGQLVGLVALRERNRVTARGRGGAGGEGGKHLEGGKEEREREEEGRGGKGQSGIYHSRQEELHGWDEASWGGRVSDTEELQTKTKRRQMGAKHPGAK